ncbi:MAG: threonine synthase, partial [Betaproteobacteria bacterium]|nr:threonine synthase [Betaproteobacteria bacterium]
MLYVSTRGEAPARRFTEILLEGLAADGGLYVPERYPKADLKAWRSLAYRDLAYEILSRFMDDLPDLRRLVHRSYTKAAFGSDDITPLATLEPGLHILGLSNGPTLAFKDLAMQLLGNLFEEALARGSRTLNILGATSGDTGSAAEYAMRGKQGIQVFMLSPHGRMSAFQRAQMFSLQDPNIHNLAVKGVFDDCQDVVKQVNADTAFKEQYRIGAVNSINWARIAAQVVYYFKGYFAATRSDTEQVSFAVPSGNFGNIYAGYVAREMGLPVRRLILASNENDVLDEFFRTGSYRLRKTAAATSSPSMDISKASNF